jgi:transposase-like protein
MSTRDWSNFACPNPHCAVYAQTGQKNLRPHGWSSKSRGIRCLRCTVCGKNFSERTGTPLFGIRMSDQKALDITHHLVEGNGMRPTSRLCGVTLNTVLRFAHKAGEHAQLFHDQMVQHVRPQQVQADEAWSYVGKKRQAL